MPERGKPQWPEHMWPLADVTAWIESVSGIGVKAVGPSRIYSENAHGVIAAFTLDLATNGDETVIFKGCRLSAFAGRLQTEELLSRYAPDFVPMLLATKALPDGKTWTLHRSFSGVLVKGSGEFENVLKIARTLAQIQTRIATILAAEKNHLAQMLPRASIADIPKMLEHMIQCISETYLDAWLADDGALLNEFDLPTNVLEQLEYFRPQVQKWTDELIAGGWPMSIDHMDLHTNNAAIQANGQVLIFDWEETGMGCPFFSIFRLLLEASKFEDTCDNPPRTEGPLRLTAKQMAIRNVYIESLPWKDRAHRERAFDIATCLAPIKTAYYECVTIKAALNREKVHPSVPARCFGAALHYWQAMSGYFDLNVRSIAADELDRFSEMGGYADEYLREIVPQWWASGQSRPEWCFVVEEDEEWIGRVVYLTLPVVYGNDPTVIFEFLMIPWDDDDAYLEFGAELFKATLSKLQAQGITAVGRHVWSGIDHPQKMHTLVQALGMTAQRDKASFRWIASEPLATSSKRLDYRSLAEVGEITFIDAIQKVTADSLDRSLQKVLSEHSPEAQAKGMFDECQKDFVSQPEWWQLALGADDNLIGLLMPVVLRGEQEEGCICYIGVVPESRGQGYIDDLIIQATKTLQSAGILSVIADTDTENFPMIKAFQRVGYQSNGTGTDYLGTLGQMLRSQDSREVTPRTGQFQQDS